MTYRLLFGLVLVLLGVGKSFAQPLAISEQTTLLDLNQNLEYSQYNTEVFHLDTLRALDWQVSENGANMGVAKSHYWFRYEINNQGNSAVSRYFYIPNHVLHKIDLYLISENAEVREIHTGTNRSFSNKAVPTKGYALPLDFPQGVSEIYLHVENIYNPLRVDAYILDRFTIDKTMLANQRTIAFWRGVFYFAILISLFLYIFIRRNLYLYFFLQHLGASLYIGMELGDFFIFFDSDPYNILHSIGLLGVILLLTFLPLFLNELTAIKKYNKRVWNLMMYGIYFTDVLLLIMALTPLRSTIGLYYSIFIFSGYPAVVFILQLYFLVVCLVNKQKNSLILTVVYSVYLSVVIGNIILPNLGILNDDLIIHKTALSASLLESLMFLFIMSRETLLVYRDRLVLQKKQQTHQREMLMTTLETQENERNSLGRELHDLVGSNLWVIKLHFEPADKKLKVLLDDTINTVRNVSHGLVTPKWSGDEFVDEVKKLCHNASNEEMRFYPYFYAWKPIADEHISLHFMRIIQEFINNAIKHSKAKNVHIHIYTYPKYIQLTYEDDGIGFGQKEKLGVGLKGVSHRLEILNGHFKIENPQKNKGTLIELEIPIHR